jgi:hypothetical protein
MPLHLTLDQDGEDVDVILYKIQGDEDALEIVGLDIEHTLVCEAFGDEPPSSFWLWMHYGRHGLDGFIHQFPLQLHDAFESQGYDVFSDGSYDRSDFLQEVASNLQSAEEDKISDNIEVLEYAVKHGEYDEEEFINDLIEALKTIAESDDQSDLYPYEGVIILQKLIYILPGEAFKFIVDEPVKQELDTDFTVWYLGYSAVINEEEILNWVQTLNVSITDPITFDISVSDPCDDNPESCPPLLATEIMEMMGWRYPEPDIAFPDIPAQDYAGDWGVQYVNYKTRRIEGPYYKRERIDSVTEEQVIEYETENDAKAAASLSIKIFASHGISVGCEYDINIVRWDVEADEWVVTERFE